MNIALVINQLKLLATVFKGNVAGAADYAYAVSDQVWLPMPAAYVVPGSKMAGENKNMNALYQIVTEQVRVIVIMDNTADRRGQNVAEQLETIQASIFAAILNWRPDWRYDLVYPADIDPQPANREARGLCFVEADIVEMDRARLKYEWVFALEVTIDETNGWQQPAPTFAEIELIIKSTIGTGAPVTAEVLLNTPDTVTIAGEGSIVVR